MGGLARVLLFVGFVGLSGAAHAQELVPLPRQRLETHPRVAVIGQGNVSLADLGSIDASASGKVAIAFWPNENITSFMAFNRGAGSTAADSVSLKQMLFPQAANTGFEGYVAFTWDVTNYSSTKAETPAKGGTAVTPSASTTVEGTPAAAGSAGATSPSDDHERKSTNRAGPYAAAIYQRFTANVGEAAKEYDSMYLEIGGLYQYTYLYGTDSRFGATLGLSWRVQSVLTGSRSEYKDVFSSVEADVDPVYTYRGIGFKAALQVNDFAFEFDLQRMTGAGGADVPGVTGWSGLVTTSILGNLLHFPPGDEPKPKKNEEAVETTPSPGN